MQGWGIYDWDDRRHLCQPVGFVPNVSPITIFYLENQINTSNASSYTFTRGIGSNSPTRYALYTVVWNGAVTLDSATVDGTAAVIVGQQANGSTRVGIVISSVPVPTGDPTLIVNFSGTAQCCGVGCFGIYDLISTTATDTAATNTDNSGQSIDVNAGGCAIGVSSSALSTDSVSWTNITERYDAQLESGVARHSGASVTSSTSTTLTLTANWTTGTTVAVFYATFR